MTNKHVFNHFHHSPAIQTPSGVRSLTPLRPPFGPLPKVGSVVKCTPLVGPVHESPDPEIRQDRWGITKNTLFHVYLSLFIISDASQRPPDDFLKIDFFENLIFDYMVPHSISWVPDFRDKPWLPRTFGNLVYLHQTVGGDSHQLYHTEYATFGGLIWI